MALRVYYPSVTVALGIRFDEALHIIREGRKTPSTEIARRVPPNQQSLNDLQASLDAQASTEPLFVSTKSDDLSWLVNQVPRTAEVTKPGYEEAGTFRAIFGFHEFPVDPIFIKAAQVRVFAGCVDPMNFATGVTEVIPVGGGRNVRRSILQSIDAAGQPISDLLACWGIADNLKADLGDNSTVEFVGRDLRSVFMSTKMLRGDLAKLDLRQTIDDVARQIISKHPMGGHFRVEVQPADWPNGLPSPGAAGNVTRVNLGPSGKKSSGLTPGQRESHLDYWMALAQYCYLVGAAPYIRGRTVTIRPMRSMYDLRDKAVFDPAIKTPFALGAVRQRPDNKQPFAIRKIIYGHNVERITIDRTLQGVNRPKVVEVVCLDTSSSQRGKAKFLSAVWPRDVADQLRKKHVTKESPSGQLGENEVRRVPVYGIRNQAQLQEIARGLWESLARFEVQGHFETKDLASYVGAGADLDPNDDPDLLRTEVGEPVEMSVAAQKLGAAAPGDAPIVSDLNQLDGASFEDAVAQVARRVGDKDIARAIVGSRRNAVVETQSIYRTSKVNINWAKESGAKISCNFHNYIEARYDDLLTDVPAPKRVRSTVVPNQVTSGELSKIVKSIGGNRP